MDPMDLTDAELTELRNAIRLHQIDTAASIGNFERLCGVLLIGAAIFLDKEIARRAAKK